MNPAPTVIINELIGILLAISTWRVMHKHCISTGHKELTPDLSLYVTMQGFNQSITGSISIRDFGDHGPPLIAILCLSNRSSIVNSHPVSDVAEPGVPWSSRIIWSYMIISQYYTLHTWQYKAIRRITILLMSINTLNIRVWMVPHSCIYYLLLLCCAEWGYW